MIADAWARLRKNKAAVVSLFILIVIILLAILAPIFSKYDFAFTDYSNVYSMPTKEHIFGCDQFGRDLWTRVWMGTRISLMIALVAAVLDLVVGVLYGAVSALLGGRVDAIMQRIIEILSDGVSSRRRNDHRGAFHYGMGKYGTSGTCRNSETEKSGVCNGFPCPWKQ